MTYDVAHHFSENNLPFGIASSETHPKPQAVTRIGNTVIFLHDLADDGLFNTVDGLPENVFARPVLNDFAALPRSCHRSVRAVLLETYQKQGLEGFLAKSRQGADSVAMHLPVEIRDFSDFSCSLDHVTNAGRIITGSTHPPPAFFKFPIGYQGRTSSIVVSGTDIERPRGQFRDPDVKNPIDENAICYGPSRKVDYEVEFAAVVGKPLGMGTRLEAKDADDHIFGYVLVNDWSARDIQGFEMMPLGPFNGKSLGTTLSPWIVTLDALEPFRAKAASQNAVRPTYLQDSSRSTYSITLQVDIITESASTIGTCPLENLYWTPRQMIAHSVSSGSALRTGDILATGTISGSEEGSHGCLLESTEGGTRPVRLVDGSERAFLEDGDVVRITALAGGVDGVGFGECVGRLVASRQL